MKKLIACLFLLLNASLGFSQTGDQIALALADPTFLPGTWKAVPQNATILSSVAATAIAGAGTSGNMLLYSSLAAWDSNRHVLHFNGNDHQDINHYVTYSETTNNWAIQCYSFNPTPTAWNITTSGASSGPTTVVGVNLPVFDANYDHTWAQEIGSTIHIVSAGTNFVPGDYLIVGRTADHFLTINGSPTPGGAGSTTGGIDSGCPGNSSGGMAHGYQHIAVDSITGNVLDKDYLGSDSHTMHVWKLPGGDFQNGANPWVEVASGPLDDNFMACFWRNGPDLGISAATSADSGGSYGCVSGNPSGGEYGSYSPRRNTWHTHQGGVMPGQSHFSNNENVGDYNPESNSIVYGGGNSTVSSAINYDDGVHIWRRDDDGNAIQLTDSPIVMGISSGGTIITEPGTRKFLFIGADCSPNCSPYGNGNPVQFTKFDVYELDPFTYNSGSARDGVYTHLLGSHVPLPMTPGVNVGTGLAAFGASNGGAVFFAMPEYGVIGVVSCFTRDCSFLLYKPDDYNFASYSTRAAAPGVIRAINFGAGDFTHYSASTTPPYAPKGVYPQDSTSDYSFVNRDITESPDIGGSSVGFTIPPGVNLVPGYGLWYTNNHDDYSGQLNGTSGCTVYAPTCWVHRFFEVLEKIDHNYLINNWENGDGFKYGLSWGLGDSSTSTFAPNCTNSDLIMFNTFNRGYPTVEYQCNVYGTFEQTLYGDISLENARQSPYCMYAMGGASSPPPINPNPFTDPTTVNRYFSNNGGNCFQLKENDWTNLQYELVLGPLGHNGTIGGSPNDMAVMSWVRIWGAHENERLQPIFNYGPFDYPLGETIGKVWLSPYDTNRCYNGSIFLCANSYPTAHAWFSDLIISNDWIGNAAIGNVFQPGTTSRAHLRPEEEEFNF